MQAQAGLDSLAAVELRNAVAAKFSVDLPATVSFDYPTVAALAAFVASLMAPEPAGQEARREAGSRPSLRGSGRRGSWRRGSDVAAFSAAGAGDVAEVTEALQQIVANVLGGIPDPSQPLMEVRNVWVPPGLCPLPVHASVVFILGIACIASVLCNASMQNLRIDGHPPLERPVYSGQTSDRSFHCRACTWQHHCGLPTGRSCHCKGFTRARGLSGPLLHTQAGLDSLAAVELRNAVAAKFAVDLPATVTFDYPTVAALAGFVASLVAPAGMGGNLVEDFSPHDWQVRARLSVHQVNHCLHHKPGASQAMASLRLLVQTSGLFHKWQGCGIDSLYIHHQIAHSLRNPR